MDEEERSDLEEEGSDPEKNRPTSSETTPSPSSPVRGARAGSLGSTRLHGGHGGAREGDRVWNGASGRPGRPVYIIIVREYIHHTASSRS